MKKEKFFRNCPRIENKKIHWTDVANIQQLREITDDDLLKANSGLGSLGLDSLKNILTSLDALETLEQRSWDNMQLDELYLLERGHIRSKTLNLISRCNLLLSDICDNEDRLIHLSQSITELLSLGNQIGIYNSNIENIQALRDNEKIKKSQSTGGDESNKTNRSIRKLVVDIVKKMTLDKRINSSPLSDKALAIRDLILSYRTECLTIGTLQDYLSDAIGEKSKGGRPPKGKPSQEDLLAWLNTNFTKDDVNGYFRENVIVKDE